MIKLPVGFKPIKDAPKIDKFCGPCGPWILGVDKFGEFRVIRWTIEYPQMEGCWMYAYDSIEGADFSVAQIHYPIYYQELPIVEHIKA